jgi:hypothetical protein
MAEMLVGTALYRRQSQTLVANSLGHQLHIPASHERKIFCNTVSGRDGQRLIQHYGENVLLKIDCSATLVATKTGVPT